MFPPVSNERQQNEEDDDTIELITGLIFEKRECIGIFQFKEGFIKKRKCGKKYLFKICLISEAEDDPNYSGRAPQEQLEERITRRKTRSKVVGWGQGAGHGVMCGGGAGEGCRGSCALSLHLTAREAKHAAARTILDQENECQQGLWRN